MNISLKQRIAQGEALIGTIITLPSPEIAEIIRAAGYDWLFVDLEHSTLSIQDAQAILQAAGPELPCLLRIPANNDVWIKKSLDIGASGIFIPQIKTAEELRQTVQFAKYAPLGNRSVGIARAQGYGASFQSYIDSANDAVVLIPQIEHIDAVKHIDEILLVPGIDAILIGPYDLSGSMGKIGEVEDAAVQKAIAEVKEKAINANVPVGIFAATAERAKQLAEDGYQLILVGIDTMLFSETLRNNLALLKK